MSTRPVVHLIFLLAMLLVLPASRSWAELAPWDQAEVARLARELQGATDALSQTFIQQPPPNLGSLQSESYSRLKQLVRMLGLHVAVFAKSLEEGEGRDQTVWMYETLMSLARSARLEAGRVFVTKDVGERAAAVRGVLNRLGPYYDPDFQTIAPHPNLEPGATR